MKARPIIFSGPMVRAIMEGKKTTTRRVIKPQPDNRGAVIFTPAGETWYVFPTESEVEHRVKCPYGQPGDRLWTRETWAIAYMEGVSYQVDYGTGVEHDSWLTSWDESLSMLTTNPPPNNWEVVYRADFNGVEAETIKWRPSIFMPRWASRLTLGVTDVRVERVQDISGVDVPAEGVNSHVHPEADYFDASQWAEFAVLWDSINEKRGYPWASNPWVWVVEFKEAQG